MNQLAEFSRQNTVLKGTKKAIVRAPHRFIGNKSIEDRLIIEWTKDFVAAESALDLIIEEAKKLAAEWRNILKNQDDTADAFVELYAPIKEENVYKITQETPESAKQAVDGFKVALQQVSTEIEPILYDLEHSFIDKVKGAKESIESIQKTLKKREHKKIDWDRANNAVEKQVKKQNMTEKEQNHLAKLEIELDQALELFQAYDEKIKKSVPYFLNSLSELLNPLTAMLYMTQQTIFEIYREHLHNFCQAQGLLVEGGAKVAEYVEIVEDWESAFVVVQPRCEQGIKTLRDGKVAGTPMTMPSKKKYEQVFHKISDSTESLAQKVYRRAKHPTRQSKILFSSPTQGMFRSEADIASAASPIGSAMPTSPMHHRSPTSTSSITSSSRTKSPLGRYHTDFPSSSTIDSNVTTRVRGLSSSSAQALSINNEFIPPKSDNDEYATALYTFQGTEPGDVAFRVGDKIRVFDHGDEIDKMWWFGETVDGRVGLFPCNYVDLGVTNTA